MGLLGCTRGHKRQLQRDCQLNLAATHGSIEHNKTQEPHDSRCFTMTTLHSSEYKTYTSVRPPRGGGLNFSLYIPRASCSIARITNAKHQSMHRAQQTESQWERPAKSQIQIAASQHGVCACADLDCMHACMDGWLPCVHVYLPAHDNTMRRGLRNAFARPLKPA